MHRRTLLAALGTLGVGSAAATLSAATLSETSSLNARFKVCVSGVNASGGTTHAFTDDDNQAYIIHEFDTVGTHTFTVNDAGNCGADDVVDVLVVGGGGGGGSSDPGRNSGCGGGGGAGGLVFEQNFAISTGDYTVEVGAGGARRTSPGQVGNDGDDSSFGTVVANGGGGGGAGNDSGSDGRDGGSGGGAGNDGGSGGSATQPNSASGGSGNDGGDNSTIFGDMTAGGGGAGGPGESIPELSEEDRDAVPGGDGGIGKDYSLEFGPGFGENGFFAGGGGGGVNDAGGANNIPGDGGSGGGGDGGGVRQDGVKAEPRTGGGGGGAGMDGRDGGAGGSGIVLIRYAVE